MMPSRRRNAARRYSALVLDTRANLWVEHFRLPDAVEPAEWSVFDQTGRWLGVVDLPPDLDVLEIGEDYLIARTTNHLDVELVHLYRLTPDP